MFSEIADFDVKKFDLMAFGGVETFRALQVYLLTNSSLEKMC